MRRLSFLLVAASVAALITLGAPLPAGAQDDEPAPTAEIPIGDIVPKPNSGDEPTDAGDRGGSLQLVLFGGIVVVLGVGIVRLAVLVKRGDERRTPPASDA